MLDLLDDPALPFFIQWQSDPALHPSATSDGQQAPGITRVEICGDAAKVGEWLGEPVARAEFQIDWVDDGDPGLSAVHFSTGNGVVRID